MENTQFLYGKKQFIQIKSGSINEAAFFISLFAQAFFIRSFLLKTHSCLLFAPDALCLDF
ncbi:MAG: hypothetical protein RIR31_184 [Bacteroidota bacterium]|jgi:hypothetical protein